MKRAAAVTLCGLALLMLLAGWVAPHSYSEQFRKAPNAQASRQFPLGTDALGRDRLSRALYGGRLSLVCAPVAALLSGLFAIALGLAGGLGGRRTERIVIVAADL